MMEEMATAASSQLYSETYENIKRGLIDALSKKSPIIAIELYSGNLVLDKDQLTAHVNRRHPS